jgi:hypothetical protein
VVGAHHRTTRHHVIHGPFALGSDYPHVVKPPHRPLLLRVIRSSVLIWLLARVMYALIMVIGVLIGGLLSLEAAIQFALHPLWPSRILLVLIAAVLVHLDRAFAHEHLLQANFGVSVGWFWATSFVTATLADLVVQTLLNTI